MIPTKVLVCLTDSENNYCIDAELPVHMPAKSLSIGILRLLKETSPLKYAHKSHLELLVRESRLKDDQTLASAGVWDGSEIELRFSGKDYRPMKGDLC